MAGAAGLRADGRDTGEHRRPGLPARPRAGARTGTAAGAASSSIRASFSFRAASPTRPASCTSTPSRSPARRGTVVRCCCPGMTRMKERSESGSAYSVVIHEFTHKLDLLNGDADGVPPFSARLHPQLRRRRLACRADRCLRELRRRARTGRERAAVRPRSRIRRCRSLLRAPAARRLRGPGSRRILRGVVGGLLRRTRPAAGGFPAVVRPADPFFRQDPLRR